MTTTDFGGFPPSPPAATPTRRLRRSRTDRVGAGVAGGLGDYFALDPVLFRVLFATSAFFGGAGILAYLLAWAAIPDAGTERAAVDGWVSALRRRGIPFWVVAGVAGILLWLVAFSWWAPGPFFPVMAVVILLVFAFARRGRDSTLTATVDAPVSLEKDATAVLGAPAGSEARGWLADSLQAGRVRRRRAAPVRLATLGVLALTLVVLGLVDAATGIVLPAYFWAAAGILLAGLVIGAVLRRTPWSLATLLVPAVLGVVAFAGSHASLHDGTGQRQWRPTTSVDSSYRLAFGQGVLDLRKLAPQGSPRSVNVTMAAGQLRILAPKTMNLSVDANIRFGDLSVDGQQFDSGSGTQSGGYNYNQIVDPPSGASGQPITVTVHLADGNIDVRRG